MSNAALNLNTAALSQPQLLSQSPSLRRGRGARGIAYVLLLSTLPARAEAPLPQAFWNYLVEFGDAQGEVFDPADYAEVANLPDKARAEFNRAQSRTENEVAPAAAPPAHAGQEQHK